MREIDSWRLEIYAEALETFGKTLQMIVAIEEMSELTKVLTKMIRHGDPPDRAFYDHYCEECADVEIGLEQLVAMAPFIFGSDMKADMELKKNAKIWELERRLREFKKEHGDVD